MLRRSGAASGWRQRRRWRWVYSASPPASHRPGRPLLGLPEGLLGLWRDPCFATAAALRSPAAAHAAPPDDKAHACKHSKMLEIDIWLRMRKARPVRSAMHRLCWQSVARFCTIIRKPFTSASWLACRASLPCWPPPPPPPPPPAGRLTAHCRRSPSALPLITPQRRG